MVALLGTIGHVADIGGTKDSLLAREIYEEGFQIPPMKLFRAGVLERGPPDPRSPRTSASASRCSATSTPWSRPTPPAPGGSSTSWTSTASSDLEALATVIQDRSEAAMREAIRRVPDGVYESEI